MRPTKIPTSFCRPSWYIPSTFHWHPTSFYFPEKTCKSSVCKGRAGWWLTIRSSKMRILYIYNRSLPTLTNQDSRDHGHWWFLLPNPLSRPNLEEEQIPYAQVPGWKWGAIQTSSWRNAGFRVLNLEFRQMNSTSRVDVGVILLILTSNHSSTDRLYHMFVLNSDDVGTFQALLSTPGSIFTSDKVLDRWVLTPFCEVHSELHDMKGR